MTGNKVTAMGVLTDKFHDKFHIKKILGCQFLKKITSNYFLSINPFCTNDEIICSTDFVRNVNDRLIRK